MCVSIWGSEHLCLSLLREHEWGGLGGEKHNPTFTFSKTGLVLCSLLWAPSVFSQPVVTVSLVSLVLFRRNITEDGQK